MDGFAFGVGWELLVDRIGLLGHGFLKVYFVGGELALLVLALLVSFVLWAFVGVVVVGGELALLVLVGLSHSMLFCDVGVVVVGDEFALLVLVGPIYSMLFCKFRVFIVGGEVGLLGLVVLRALMLLYGMKLLLRGGELVVFALALLIWLVLFPLIPFADFRLSFQLPDLLHLRFSRLESLAQAYCSTPGLRQQQSTSYLFAGKACCKRTYYNDAQRNFHPRQSIIRTIATAQRRQEKPSTIIVLL